MTSELSILAGRNKTVLEIRDFLSGEFEPVPLSDVTGYFEAQRKIGSVKLTEKPTDSKTKTSKTGTRK